MGAADERPGCAVLEAIRQARVVAILRATDPTHLVATARLVAGGGLRVVELPLTTPGALASIEELARDPDLVLGAGTVLSSEDAESAVGAGARFLVTPTVEPDVMEAALRHSVPVILGAFTPTEVLEAHRLGASAVKVFPASVGGPSYLRALRDPLPGVPLVPTGGVAIEDAPSYLAAGALAVGMGGPLLGDALAGGDRSALRARVARLVELIEGAA
ncbi:MAG: bifunctional 4-hydroxy-2-oxoglutarate aldolase/2-dehydro-3-deoxy-phosphogluconate aldolase [Actinomycetota bacterium]|nr:bifunctional 4-hydroxy-2-oxoglutarate aldolase/2-dehydro-3-deoxy-phosphogluconate aldolase [Actinomycetota bacterium]